MKALLTLILFGAVAAFGQANEGQLQLTVTDSLGHGVEAAIEIVSVTTTYSAGLTTDADGRVNAPHLPFGAYRIEVRRPGYADVSEPVAIHSSIPTRSTIQLRPASVTESVMVKTDETEPDQAGSVDRINTQAIQDRVGSIPGRSIEDLVNTQPGWVYEGNAVLHPRGSEYQTQFVIDGIPLTDNRAPSFGPEIEADDIQSVSIYTAGIPAE